MNTISLKINLFTVLLLMTYSCNAQKIKNKSTWKYLDSLVAEQLKEKHIPSISLGVVKDGKIIYLKGYGYADPEKKKPANAKTVYQLGSVSKTITGHLLAKLITEKRIRLEDSLSSFFPSSLDFPKYPDGTAITIRDVATHSAELPRYPANLMRVDPDPITGYSYEEMLTGLAGTKIDTIGGHRFNYSNFGYGVLGTAMQNRIGKDLAKLFKEKIFKTYDMRNSSLVLNSDLKKKLAVPFLEVDPLVKTEAWKMETLAAAGNIFSNVEDMCKFILAIMKDNRANQLQQTRLQQINENSWYGLGCFIIDSKKVNTTLVYHGGDVDGYSSSLKYYPEYDIGTVLLTNYGEGRVISEVFMDIEIFILDMLRKEKSKNK